MRGHCGSSRRVIAAAAGLWTAVALAQASAAATEPVADAHLYEAAYRAISTHYLEAIGADQLALAGLARLGKIDDALSVEREDRLLVLRQSRTVIDKQPAPEPEDFQGWGQATAALLDAARHVSPPVAATSEDKLDEAVIDGGVALLDRFSRYAPPTVAIRHRDSRDGYGGIGVTLDLDRPGARVAMVIPDSPAASAGLAIGDRITSIDGIKALAISHDDIVDRLRGPVGSSVRLDLARDGLGEALRVTLKRSRIVISTVTFNRDDRIAVLHIADFNARTADNLAEQIAAAHHDMGDALAGIVLDLRDNPGGLLDQSVEVASQFLDRGEVVATEGRVSDSNQLFEVDRHGPAEKLPLVVLVNGGSASASEIVAAALQDQHRAVIVGTSSYGKGTVQNVIHLPNQGELTVTWARLIPPGGYILHEHGVIPAVCTADLAEAAKAVPVAGRPRAELDDRAWSALRRQCPPEKSDRAVDLKVAEWLLTNPGRYAQALADEPAMPMQSAAAETARPGSGGR
jgi:carboxyl-terminal processing protease